MTQVLENLLETNPEDASENYYHGTSENNFREIMAEGGLRSNNRNNCQVDPGTQVVKEDIIRMTQGQPNLRENEESIVENLPNPSHYKIDVVDYLDNNLEEFKEQASNASNGYIEAFEELKDMREEFEDPILEFKGPGSGVHLNEVNSLAGTPETAEFYGDLTLEIQLPEDSTYYINGFRVPGIIPLDFVSTVYGPEETVETLEEDFNDQYGISYSEDTNI
jgi:hypothetical protein